ncbi:MAG: DUF4349 domain-containing protein [Ruminococcaceae bacterium]|nr:DUF4349 domain-containing protein [Oscillospiraceae bacterium]
MKATQKWTLALAVILMLCCVLTSCSKSYDNNYAGGANKYPADMAPSVEGDYGYGNTKLPENNDTTDKESGEEIVQKIIRTVYMDAQTKEFDHAVSSIREALKTAGGFEESFTSNNRSYGSTGYYSRTATMTLRIPAEKLDAFLSEVGGLLHITSQRANVQNVTNEYYDIEARLNVLESERAVYETMLQNAKTTSEMLSIRDRLYNVIEEIEAYKTRLRVLESQVAYSTVHLSLSEVVEYSKVTEQDASFGDRVYDAFWTGWYSFVDNAEDFAVWFVRNVTTIGTLAIIGLLVLIIILATNKKHAPKSPTTPTGKKGKSKKAKKNRQAEPVAQPAKPETETAPAPEVQTEPAENADENNQ